MHESFKTLIMQIVQHRAMPESSNAGAMPESSNAGAMPESSNAGAMPESSNPLPPASREAEKSASRLAGGPKVREAGARQRRPPGSLEDSFVGRRAGGFVCGEAEGLIIKGGLLFWRIRT